MWLEIVDPEIAAAIKEEEKRQAFTIELIAATNFPSRAILEVQGSILAYKTLEGYLGKRYHKGHANVDIIEKLAIERAKKLFGAEHVNVQPHSGVNANLAVFLSILKPGDRILAMDLAHGGHLSHGSKTSLSGKYFQAFFYGVNKETEMLDYEEIMTIASKVRPKLIIAGASSYSRIIDFAKFKEIADEVRAYLLADIAHIAGFVAVGEHPSPVPYADFVTFTTYKTMRGARGGVILCKKEYASKIDAAVFPGVQGSMHVHLIAAKAVTFKLAMTQAFRNYIKQVRDNARALAKGLSEKGFRIISGGTDNHIILVDLRNVNLTGKQAEELLEEVGITVNRNQIPFDPLGPEVTSGIRLGSAAMTARGFQEEEMYEVADIISSVLLRPTQNKIQIAKERVKKLCLRFPLYMDKWEMESTVFENI
ncbi:MAG: serine hydroxymethyltransferase [Conexivisphaerales archaeon]